MKIALFLILVYSQLAVAEENRMDFGTDEHHYAVGYKEGVYYTVEGRKISDNYHAQGNGFMADGFALNCKMKIINHRIYSGCDVDKELGVQSDWELIKNL